MKMMAVSLYYSTVRRKGGRRSRRGRGMTHNIRFYFYFKKLSIFQVRAAEFKSHHCHYGDFSQSFFLIYYCTATVSDPYCGGLKTPPRECQLLEMPPNIIEGKINLSDIFLRVN